MTDRFRDGLFATFVFACLVLGGASREGHLANFALQVSGLGFLGWGLYRLDWRSLGTPERLLLVLGGLGLVIIGLQFIPLPPELWRTLPGRSEVAAELDMLGVQPDPGLLTFSLHESLRSAMSILPALALAIALMARRSLPTIALAVTIVGTALLSLGVGIMQVLGGTESAWYLYDFTNRGWMVGFFANANHMATLLLVSLPFLAALLRDGRTRLPLRRMEFTILGCALCALIAMGVGLAGSLTGYALLAPVALASSLIVWPPSKRLSWFLALPVVIFSGAALAILGDGENALSSEARSSLLGREQIQMHGVTAAQDFFPVGSGLGTFEEVYRRYEDEQLVTSNFINHAHNDYLELIIELGAPGLALIALFWCWWLYCLHRLLIVQASPFAWAGWIAVGVFLTHSGWDYPLRTAALAAVFAIGCVLTGRIAPPLEQDWPTASNHRPPRKR